MTAMDPRITVVVCTDDDRANVSATLDALDAQTVRSVAEVIVVGDASCGGTAGLAGREGVTLIWHDSRQRVSAARNAGWRVASAPLVVFTNGDCLPREDWLARLMITFAEHPGAAAVGGSLVVRGSGGFVTGYLERRNPVEPPLIRSAASPSLPQRLRHQLKVASGRDRGPGTCPAQLLLRANMAFRIEALKAVDGFDESMEDGAEEDLCRRLVRDHSLVPAGLELAGTVKSSSAALWFDPSAVVEYEFPDDLAHPQRWSLVFGSRHGSMFQPHHEPVPVIYPLPLAVLTLWGCAALLRSRWQAAAGALVPLLLFSRWRRFLGAGWVYELVYPYLQLVDEGYANMKRVANVVRRRSHKGGR